MLMPMIVLTIVSLYLGFDPQGDDAKPISRWRIFIYVMSADALTQYTKEDLIILIDK